MEDLKFPTRTQVPYVELLKRDEWLIKKAHIIARDKNQCCNCGKTGDEVPLEVHHKAYAKGYDPWEYPDDALITLCSDCHREWHKSNRIRCVEKHDDGWYWVNKVPCLRCGGLGYLPEYDYYKNGICFRCWGERFEGAERRIRLFTEEHGQTPQEYFDVFTPLTDEEVVRIYNEKYLGLLHGEESFIVQAHIQKKDNHYYVYLCANTGLVYTAFLDGSMIDLIDKDSSRIQCLNTKTLLYKECMNKSHQRYLLVKGDIISYAEAKKMADEIIEVHGCK